MKLTTALDPGRSRFVAMRSYVALRVFLTAYKRHSPGTPFIGRREQSAHHAALRRPKDSCTFGFGRIHDSSDVVHPVIQSRQPVHPDPIRQPGTTFVEHD